MYFKSIPKLVYPLAVRNEEHFFVLKDITVNVRFVKEVLSNITLYDLYDIREGETPEILSDKFYGTPFYHWIIMIANDRYDLIADWPLTSSQLTQYVFDKYGVDNAYDTHHHENAQGYVVSSDYPLATPISNFTYEDRINESKRRIKVIDKGIIEQVVSEFMSKVKS